MTYKIPLEKMLIILMGAFWLITCAGCKSTEEKVEIVEEKVEDNVYIMNINVGGKNKAEVEQIINEISSNIDEAPKDAQLDEANVEIIPEVVGKKLNINGTMNAVLNAKEGERVEPIIEEITPNTTLIDVEKKLVEIGSYSTPLLDDSENRVNNIDTAADYLNNEKVLPGQEFSFNETLGRRTSKKGYKKAPIIKRTENGPVKGYGVGGGICQLSSTLYNAADEAGLEITERHPHSKKVPYVPKGKDATVSYGSTDFKFKNNRQNPIVVKAEASGGKVTVRVLEIIQ